jgi:hypothetical protein
MASRNIITVNDELEQVQKSGHDSLILSYELNIYVKKLSKFTETSIQDG